jgi:hypothetical protein
LMSQQLQIGMIDRKTHSSHLYQELFAIST